MQITVLPVLDLAISDSYNDMNSLSIVDLSQYSVLPGPSDVALQITPPGYPTVNVPFTPGSVNVYKCIDLGMTCSTPDCCPLPDGIYDVKYSISIPKTVVQSAANSLANSQQQPIAPYLVEKTFIRVDNIRCKWMNAFLKVDLECECSNPEQKGYKDELKRIDLLINGAVAAANNCDPSLSDKLYQKANSMLDLLCCKFNMPCGSITCNSCGCHK